MEASEKSPSDPSSSPQRKFSLGESKSSRQEDQTLKEERSKQVKHYFPKKICAGLVSKF